MKPPFSRQQKLRRLLSSASTLASDYYDFTGKPLAATADIAELIAIEKLGIDPVPSKTTAFNATGSIEGELLRYQIKGRAVDPKQVELGRIVRIRKEEDFDAILLVLMERATLQPLEIWSARKDCILKALATNDDKRRAGGNALSIVQFKELANRLWPTR